MGKTFYVVGRFTISVADGFPQSCVFTYAAVHVLRGVNSAIGKQ